MPEPDNSHTSPDTKLSQQSNEFAERAPNLYRIIAGTSTWVLLDKIPQFHFCDLAELSVVPHP